MLVDNLGAACVPLLATLFGAGGVDRNGIGRARQPVPLVAVLLGTGDDIRRQVRDRTVPTAPWVEVHRLEPFTRVGDEDLLAYESVLLYPFRGAAGTLERRAWMFNRELEPVLRERMTDFMRRELAGLPGNLGKSDKLRYVLEAANAAQLLIPVDDERAVA